MAEDRPPTTLYMDFKGAQIDNQLYDQLSASGHENIVKLLTVAKKSGLAWEMKAGQTCRIVTPYGPQVGDLNMWSLTNTNEHFYAAKTRQLQSTHLTTYNRLWSNLPYLRPMATITKDSLSNYGFDQYGCGVHDVIGTRCDPYSIKWTTGKMGTSTCHQNLMDAIKPWNLQESDVHDVFNIFLNTGFDAATHKTIVRKSPAKKGDYIEFLAEIDLLVALSACHQGDVSLPVGEEVPDDLCHPLDVYIGQPSKDALALWSEHRQRTHSLTV